MGDRSIPRSVLIDDFAGVLLDVDGTLLSEEGAIPGAGAVIARLRDRGVPFRVLTNITRRSRRSVVDRLAAHGVEVSVSDVLTAVCAAGEWMRRRGIRRVAPFVMPDALEDLAGFELVGGTSRPATDAPVASVRPPDAVLIGDLGDTWSHALLNEAFRYVMDGAQLVVPQLGRYWLGPTGLEIDAGAYVAALEYATGEQATVCGKPNPEFFGAAVASLIGLRDQPIDGEGVGLPVAMVGDDLWTDIQGAQRAGLQGWLVRTGKYREDALASSGIRPDRVLDSVADLC
ncbi:MAG: HAD-IIA family hydrolase [Gemmatimonadales bacterium]|nr:HAD-IIA family hydrolase [Gemmatimonadales bacterium]